MPIQKNLVIRALRCYTSVIKTILKQVFKFTFLITLLLGLVIIVSPYWLSDVIRNQAEGYGVKMGTFHRLSWSHFQIDNITWESTDKTLHLNIPRLNCPNPFRIIAYHYLGIPSPAINIKQWSLDIDESKQAKPTQKAAGDAFHLESVKTALKSIQELAHWIPPLSIDNGKLTWNDTKIQLTSIHSNQNTSHIDAQGQAQFFIDGQSTHKLKVDIEFSGDLGWPNLVFKIDKGIFTREDNAFKYELNLTSTLNLQTDEGNAALEATEVTSKDPNQADTNASLETLRAELGYSPQGIDLKNLQIQVEGQQIHAQGKWPWGSKGWSQVFAGKLPDWTHASGKATLARAPVQAIRLLLPGFLRPSGHISANIKLRAGKDLSGNLHIENASTRPLSNLGSIEDIDANLAFKHEKLIVHKLSARIAESPLSIHGHIDLRDFDEIKWHLKIKGDNVPFQRQPGLILRGSPNLNISTQSNGLTTVNGTIELEKSFILVDFASLMNSSEASPDTRPPFFSVHEKPFSKWRLNIQLIGDDFLRVRTPVFEAIISARFTLNGNLQEPFTYGQASIDKGLIMFPFSTFKIQEGTLTIHQNNPFAPEIDVLGTTTTYDYDLRLNISGPPNDPRLIFTSTPALSSNEILMMVSSGKVPNDNVNRGSGNRLAGLGSFLGQSVLTDLGILDPLDNRLEIIVGEYVTEQGSETIKVQYRIDDQWAIIGQYDRFDSYDLDLKWTFYSE